MITGKHWQPGADLQKLQQRAALLAQLRKFFAERAVLEVETPQLMAACVPDPMIEALRVQYHGATTQTLYLQSSPELAMKRLLAAGSGAIYQICRAFRDNETGHLHNPEFTLLEWYRPRFDHYQLMLEVEDLLRQILQCPPAHYLSYQQAFIQYAQFDPLQVDLAQLQQRIAQWMSAESAQSLARDACLQLIMSQEIEPHLGQTVPTFVHDYPASQASLARCLTENSQLAARFEVYVKGIELANGFYELTDADEQLQRFKAELQQRQQAGAHQPPLDEKFLAALDAGLPDCAGVALGVDRLLMLQTGASCLDEVLTFSMSRL